ncbi:hypothetical protein BpHYR1_003924 [Brachionus plicatilis]|uniref:Uncharacterized protein n=1 Tax=Brachionus plicatilis TaxID=10195 RepID=A0A3M7RFD9_BRAPC|nr:hypothetical protein BpHYR1_003924 [Brachionus plicatilis]
MKSFELTFERSASCTFEVKLLLPKKRKTEEKKEDKKFDKNPGVLFPFPDNCPWTIIFSTYLNS